MDLSQYYFLGHILDELHDIKDLITREIFENADIIFEPAKFKGRYGLEKDAIFEVIRTWEDARAANAFPRKVKKLLANPENNWTLKKGETTDTWILYELVNDEKVKSYALHRSEEY